MPLLSSAVGTQFKTSDDLITQRRILSYAAAIGVTEPQYRDDALAPLVAFPTFVMASEWPASIAVRQLPALGLSAVEQQRVLHMMQDTHLHANVRPGIVLACQTTLVAVERRSSGTKTILRLESTDAAGQAVATSYVGHVFRDVGLHGKEMAIDLPPPWPALEGNPAWYEVSVPVAHGLPHIYTECTGISAPIHTERSAALAAGLPDIVLHGSATLALAVRAVMEAIWPNLYCRVQRFGCRFTGPVVGPTTLKIRYRHDGEMAVFDASTETGQSVLADGKIIFTSGFTG